MNPRAVQNFFTSKFGLFLVFVVVLFGGLWIYGRKQAEAKQAARVASSAKKVELGQVKMPLDKGLEAGVPLRAGVSDVPEGGAHKDSKIVPFRPAEPPVAVPANQVATKTGERPKPAEKPRRVRYQTLLATYEPPPPVPRGEPASPRRFIPHGTLLKCKLVNTVDSANLETPVIAVLLEDVWQNGERVIPANTLVHGTARAGRIRDRITATGAWRFVWQDGRELSFTGVALDREYEHDSDGYGITDGSAGMKGRVMATDELQELKLLASAALSGFARGTQDRTQTPWGSTMTGSVSNGVREGVGEVFDLYAQRTLRDIEENGYFVRVAAGKEFYVYVIGSVNPEKAKVAGVEPEAAPSEGEPKNKG